MSHQLKSGRQILSVPRAAHALRQLKAQRHQQPCQQQEQQQQHHGGRFSRECVRSWEQSFPLLSLVWCQLSHIS